MTEEEIANFLPYPVLGKPGEQIGLLDQYVGEIMKLLHDLKIAENTLVLFTADNGPDSTSFKMFNKVFGHLRTSMLRGQKHASMYITLCFVKLLRFDCQIQQFWNLKKPLPGKGFK